MPETQLDRIERMVKTIYDGRAGQDSPFARDDDAPEQVRQGVEGFERVFGQKPKQGTPEYSAWRKQIPLTSEVFPFVPDEYEGAAMDLAAKTGVKAVFLIHGGEMKAALTAQPNPWLVEPERFADVEGLFRAVLDAE